MQLTASFKVRRKIGFFIHFWQDKQITDNTMDELTSDLQYD